MRIRAASKTWRAKNYDLATEIEITANHVRYAEKPSDLNLPWVQLIQMARRLEVQRVKWLHAWVKERGESLKNWPKLFERYL